MTDQPNPRQGRGEWAPSQLGNERGGLEKKVAHGLTWTLVETWGSQFVGLVIFAVLTRLLSPEDFGLVALAAVFVALGQLFADQGLGDAVVQRRLLSRLQIDTAFWAAQATGLFLFALGFLAAGPIARLVGEPDLEPILQVLAVIFPLTALSSIQVGLLRRELQFQRLAVRRLVALVAGGAVGIGMALGGFGAWALVGQQLATATASVVLLWAVSPWRPSFEFSRPDFRSLFGFGFNVVGSDFLGFISRNTDNLLIGVFLGPVALGFYAVAYRLLDTSQTILISAARRLVFPSFSRLQHDLERVRRAYIRLSRTSSSLTLPGYIGLALVAPEAIVVVFGQKWADSGTAAAVLFLIGPVLTIGAFSGAVWNAVGHPEVTLRFRLVSTVANVAGFILAVAVFKDIVAVAAAYTIRGYLLLPLNLYWMRVYSGVPVRDQLWPLRGVAASTLLMALAVIGVKLVLGGGVHHIVLLAAEVTVGVVTFGVALFFIDRPLLKDVISIGTQAVPVTAPIARRFGIQPHKHRTPPVMLPAAETAAQPPLDEFDTG